MSRSWSSGSTRQWRRTRRIILARDKYRCQLALPGTWVTRDGKIRNCLGVADCVHHVQGKTNGDDRAQLVAACTPCNLKIGDPTRQPDPQPRPRTRW